MADDPKKKKADRKKKSQQPWEKDYIRKIPLPPKKKK